MESLKLMFEEYVEDEKLLTHIATYNLLQDFIENLFGRIRACGGFNNNPNVHQFKGAFRKIQCNMRMELSSGSNCRMFDLFLPDNLQFSNIYFVSSRRPRISMDDQCYENQKDSIIAAIGNAEIDPFDDTDETGENNITYGAQYLDATKNFLVIHIASTIEKKIMKSNNFHCNSCRLIFDENEKVNSMESEYFNWKPCKSTTDICKTAERSFSLYDDHEAKPRYDLKVLYCLIFLSMDLNNLYPNSTFACDLNHKYHFIKCIVGQYISNRANHVAKHFTLERQDKLLREYRNHLTKLEGL